MAEATNAASELGPVGPAPCSADLGDTGTLSVEPQRFATVPEWLLDADVSDCAVRLYVVLLRYGLRIPVAQQSAARRTTQEGLSRHRRSAMKELVALDAVHVERRRNGRRNLTQPLSPATPRVPSRVATLVRPRPSTPPAT